LAGRDLAKLVQAVIAEVGSADRVIVNSRPDIAEMAGARGVHLPESGLDPGAVRRAFPRLAIGVSRHDRPGLERAVGEGADYALLGPVFGTPGKEAALGLVRFGDLIFGMSLPLLAVGGITPENAGLLIEQGAIGVAAIRPFADPGTASVRAESLRSALDRGNALLDRP
jgi:thiamine-phosphate diphosphorylase